MILPVTAPEASPAPALSKADPRLTPVKFSPDVVVSSCSSSNEDVLLWRALHEKKNGFYVDIGAGDPNHGSVTRWFYINGWTGINIEPHPFLFPILAQWRPLDVNLNCGVAETSGSMIFYKVEVDARGEGWGLSSFDPAAGVEAEKRGYEVNSIEVPTMTLSDIAKKYCTDKEVDLLKIDVEGFEAAAIRSADWRLFRPRVLCIEATQPLTNTPSFAEWEPILLEAEYVYASFDGANNFYVRRESPELLPQFNCGLVRGDRWRPAAQEDFVEPWIHPSSWRRPA